MIDYLVYYLYKTYTNSYDPFGRPVRVLTAVALIFVIPTVMLCSVKLLRGLYYIILIPFMVLFIIYFPKLIRPFLIENVNATQGKFANRTNRQDLIGRVVVNVVILLLIIIGSCSLILGQFIL